MPFTQILAIYAIIDSPWISNKVLESRLIRLRIIKDAVAVAYSRNDKRP
jgi:hypothetical protein